MTRTRQQAIPAQGNLEEAGQGRVTSTESPSSVVQCCRLGWPRRQTRFGLPLEPDFGDRRGTNLERSLVVVELWFRGGGGLQRRFRYHGSLTPYSWS